MKKYEDFYEKFTETLRDMEVFGVHCIVHIVKILVPIDIALAGRFRLEYGILYFACY